MQTITQYITTISKYAEKELKSVEKKIEELEEKLELEMKKAINKGLSPGEESN